MTVLSCSKEEKSLPGTYLSEYVLAALASGQREAGRGGGYYALRFAVCRRSGQQVGTDDGSQPGGDKGRYP